MKILLISKHLEDSGVTSHIIEVARELKRQGHHVSCVSSGGKHEIAFEEMEVRHIKLDFYNKNPFILVKNIYLLRKILKKKRIEIIHSHWRLTSLFATIAKTFLGVELVWTNHSSDISSDFLHRKTTFFGKQVITVSSDLLPMLENKFKIPKEKISVILNGIKSDKYFEYSDTEKASLIDKYAIKDKKIICLLGRLSPVKGHIFLLNSLYKLSKTKDISNLVIIFTGEGDAEYRDKLIRLAEKYNISDNLRFVGYVNPVDVLNVTDLMVLPSENEGFGIVCVEAFAMKVPVVRTKVGGYGDMKNYCIGVDYNDEESLANVLLEFFNSDNTYKTMTENAYQFYLEELTTEKMVDKILKVYNFAAFISSNYEPFQKAT